MRSHGRFIAASSILLFLAPASLAQVTQRVSVASDGKQANDYSFAAAISADGRFVVFASWATNLVSVNTNGELELFLRDRVLGTTELISVSSNGTPANDQAWEASVSADGRLVAFSTYATNLAPGDTDIFTRDIFVRDRRAGTTECVTCGGHDTYGSPSISAEGQFIAFLAHPDSNHPVPFLHDRVMGSTVVAGPPGGGGGGWDWHDQCAISGDGRCVGYSTSANGVVPGDHDGLPDVFFSDLDTGVVECASLGPNGPEEGRNSGQPSLSHDGRYVAFGSYGSNLVPGDMNHHFDVFVRDRRSGTIGRMSISSSGVEGNGDSFGPSISGDGRFVAFYSRASNLVPDDTNTSLYYDAFVHDRSSGATERVNLGPGGSQVSIGCGSYAPYLSSDNRFVLFDSASGELVPGDTNGTGDAFVRDRLGGTTFTTLCDPGVEGVAACPCGNPPNLGDRGCDNSAGTGGARLSAEGGTFLSSDSLQFVANGLVPNVLSLLLQGSASASSGAVYGQGVRCVAGSIRRLFSKSAHSSSVLVPDFDAGDAPISRRSGAFGDWIQSGEQRWYQVIYRDPIVLGGCPSSSTFNATQAGVVTWSP